MHSSVLSKVQEVLRDEQELFGEFLLVDERATSKEAAMGTKNPVVAEELSLFDIPDAAGASATASKPITDEPWGNAASLTDLDAQICACVKCPLGHTRTKFVFGVGNPHATLMFIGEAPGADEDAQGEPFVGRAGQLLNKILEAIHFKREDVYIANILKCRPPNNREPLVEEVELCLPYLRKQIALIQPKVIVCLGLISAKYLLGTRESLGKLRGKVLRFDGIPVMVTYHPAALLRNPAWKRPAWEDVQAVRKLHDSLITA
jgi:uracil-DNA glycosylase